MARILSVSALSHNQLSAIVNLFLEHIANHDFIVIGHRGAAGLAPENTLQSFSTALSVDCPMIELDVYATTSDEGQTDLLVIHDDKLDRTTNGRGRVADFTTQRLRQLDAGGEIYTITIRSHRPAHSAPVRQR